MDSDFVSYEELGSLLEEEMHRAGDALPAPPSKPAAVVEDQNLFADEQQFFNLAEELEKELADDAPPPSAPVMAGPEGEASLEEIFREFKRGVEQQLSAEDYETHFNLGIAYKEMGLVDEAISEFQKALRGPENRVRTYEAIGHCFIEKGNNQMAATILGRALSEKGMDDDQLVGVLYLLGRANEALGKGDEAMQYYQRVFVVDITFQDVADRLSALENAAR
jgi:tetratricopeptide (TPR) repeat protein